MYSDSASGPDWRYHCRAAENVDQGLIAFIDVTGTCRGSSSVQNSGKNKADQIAPIQRLCGREEPEIANLTSTHAMGDL